MRITQLVARYLFLLAIFVAFGASPAQAVPVTFNFSGTLSASDAVLGLTAGQPITGSYTFESATQDTNPFNFLGNYLNAIQSGSINVGAYTGNITGGSISVANTTSIDNYTLLAQVNGAPLASGFQLTSLSLFMLGQFPSSGDALPTSAGDLSGFPTVFFSLMFSNSTLPGGGLRFPQLELTNISSIPEPSTFLLLGFGLFLLAWVQRKLFWTPLIRRFFKRIALRHP